MKIQEIMTPNPACCGPETNLGEVARLMVDHDCGEIPVVRNGKPVGVITDRDIAARAVAAGRNPLEMKASDLMSSPVITVTPSTDVDDCCDTMEEHQIRRVPVVDDAGAAVEWCRRRTSPSTLRRARRQRWSKRCRAPAPAPDPQPATGVDGRELACFGPPAAPSCASRAPAPLLESSIRRAVCGAEKTSERAW